MDLKKTSPYAAAILLVFLAVLLRIWPLNILGERLIWLTFYPAVTLAAFYGGFLPGFVCALLSIATIYYGWPLLSPKPFIADFADRIGMLVFLGTSTLIAAIGGLNKRLLHAKKTAYQLLKSANEQLLTINDHLPGSFVYQMEFKQDGQKHLRYLSKGINHYLSVSLKEIQNNPDLMLGIIHEEDLPRYHVARQIANEHNEMLNIDVRMKRADNTEGWININSIPHQEDGTVLWDGLVTDITKWKQLEQRLKESEAFLQETGKLAKIGGWLLNTATMEVYLTPEVYHMQNLPEGSKVTLETGLATYHPADRDHMEALLKKALNQGEGFATEARKITATGRLFWAAVICSPVIENGKITALHGVIQDITKRKELEEKLEQEHLYSQRLITELVINDYETEKSAIAYELHEDINQLLVATKMHIENLADNSGDPQTKIRLTKEYLNTAIEKINHLFDSVNAPTFTDLGFVNTMQSLIDVYNGKAGMHIRFTCSDVYKWDELPHNMQLLIYRVLSDRLHCIKHKQKAHSVDISLMAKDHTIQLAIGIKADNVVVNDEKIALDLRILESRLGFYGGRYSISYPEKNSRILEITLPIHSSTITDKAGELLLF